MSQEDERTVPVTAATTPLLAEAPTEKEILTHSEESKWPGGRLALTALLVSLGGGFNFGYQLLITNPSQEAFMQFLNSSLAAEGTIVDREQLETMWGLIVSLFFWGATVGAFFIQLIADKLGRRRGMILTFFVQAACMALAVVSYFRNAWLIYAISRTMMGAVASIALGITPLFITECSPSSCRGVISLATGMLVQLAVTVGAIVAMPQLWGTVDSWWKMYAVEAVMTLVVFCLCFLIHESPSFLAFSNKLDDARRSFIFYHNVDEKTAADKVEALSGPKSNEASFGLIQVLLDSATRRPTLLGCLVMGGMLMSGIAAINAFAFEILLSVGLTSFGAALANVAVCAMTAVGVLVSSLFIEKYGRRPLLLGTFAFLAFANIAITAFMISFDKTAQSALGWCVVAAICLFNFVFSIGPGPISLFITGELVSQEGRGAACTWANVVFNGLRSILLVVYFPLKSLLGGPISYLVLFLPPCVLATGLLYFYLPETKARSPEEAAVAAKDLPTLRKKRR